MRSPYHSVLVWAILLVLVGALAGCGNGLPALAPDQERRQQKLDGLTVTLDSVRAPEVNQAQRFQITLTDQWGRPVEGAEVYLDLEMNMLCLSGAAPIADVVGPGQYAAQSVYQMPGDWQVTVIARIANEEHRAEFAIPVVEAAG